MTEQDKKSKDEDKFKEIEEKSKKLDKQKSQDAKEFISTRTKIEGDYDDDLLKVTFNTSPETRRTVLAKKPTNKEMITIMKLSAQAAKYEGSADPDSLIKMVEIYEQLSGIADKLSLDEKLDEEFWNEKVSFSTLQNFITELISESQKGTGVTEKELKKFR
jgi:preprotein translocase subunit Sss1